MITNEQIEVAYWTIRERVLELLREMPGKQANLICYLINPECTAIGSTLDYNQDVVTNRIYDIYSAVLNKRDGNRDYTFVQLAKMISDGQI